MQRIQPDANFVPAYIRPVGDRLVVAEAAGSQEAECGEPLVGTAGSWLRGRYDEIRREWKGGLFSRAGIDDSRVSRANVLSCRPPDNRFPTDPEAREYCTREEADDIVRHCVANHLVPVLRSRDWARVDVLGDKALRAVCEKDGGIMRWRGSPLPVPILDDTRVVAVPTIHPSALARDQSMLPAVVSDLKKGLVLAPEYYNVYPSLEDVSKFTATEFAFDIETDMQTGAILCVGLSDAPFHAICVPFKGAYLGEIRRIFENARELIGHNCIQFDVPRLREQDIRIGEASGERGGGASPVLWDTMLMQHLLQPDLPHSLGFLGSIFVAKPAWKHESGMDLELYCCRDVDVTFQCWRQLRPLLAQEALLDLYRDVSVPLAGICYEMHRGGITVDPSRISAVRTKILEEMVTLELGLPEHLRRKTVTRNKRSLAPVGAVSEKTGKPIKFLLTPVDEVEFPWRSSEVVARYLYEELALPKQLHVKTAEATADKTAIAKLTRLLSKRVPSPENVAALKAIQAIQKLRALSTLETSFCREELLETKVVHPSFNVHGTSSGRLSSSDPNVQNIPESARYVYVPTNADWRFLAVDYSSIENRLTAWFANDTVRQTRWAVDPSFNEHKYVASQFFDIPYEEVVKDNSKDAPYGIAKRIGHGSNYGMGPKKIANLFDMDFGLVRDLCAKWRIVNSATVRWQSDTAALAKKQGYLVTPFGRKRWFYTDSAYTESLSFLPQSTAADIIFRAMIELRRRLPSPARIVLTVHDSLLFEFPGPLADEVQNLVISVMTRPIPELGGLVIPVEAKLGFPGQSWGEVEAL